MYAIKRAPSITKKIECLLLNKWKGTILLFLIGLAHSLPAAPSSRSSHRSAELTAQNLCRNYFIQADILQSLTPQELRTLKIAAATLSRLQQRPHYEVATQKEDINSQVLSLAKQKDFSGQVLAQFFVLFRSFMQGFKISEAPQIKQALQQQVSHTSILTQQQKQFETLKKYHSAEELEENNINLDLALLRSVEKTSFNSHRVELKDVQLLLEMGANKETLTEHYTETPLMLACKDGSLPVVETLIDSGAHVDANALVSASIGGHKHIVEYLLNRGIDKDAHNYLGETPIAGASWAGHSALVEFYLELGAKPDVPDHAGETALMKAAQSLDATSVRLLLHAGANPNYTSLLKNTPLLLATNSTNRNRATVPEQVEIVKALLAAKANIGAKDAGDKTALYYAIQNGNVKIAELLIEASAYKEIQSRTPTLEEESFLYYASEHGFTDIVRLLIEKVGLDKNLRNKDGNTPLNVAVLMNRKETVRYLLSINVDIYAKDSYGSTAFDYAFIRGGKKLVQMLIEAGMDKNFRLREKETPLMRAAYRGHEDILQYLLTLNIDINRKRRDGSTALHFASKNGHKEIVQMLLDAGANPRLRDMLLRAPLSLAKNSNHPEIVAMLEAALKEPKNLSPLQKTINRFFTRRPR